VTRLEQKIIFFMESTRKSSIEKNICLHRRTESAVKTEEFVNDRMSYTVLRGRL
jgi:hypothetical protein